MEELSRKKKRILVIGSLLGASASLVIFFMMDILLADFQQGTWRDAIVNDLNRMFSSTFDKSSPLVFAIYFIVMIILAAFGAFIGIIFMMFLERFFMFLRSE